MKATLDLENLGDIISQSVEENIKATLDAKIAKVANDYINKNLKEAIEEKVSEQMTQAIDDYINSALVTECSIVDDEPTTIPMTKYIRMKVAEFLKKGVFKEKRSTGYGYYPSREEFVEVSFKDYIDRQMNIEAEVKSQIDKYMDTIRRDINSRCKKIFESSTRDMISNAVVNILQQNRTYKEIASNIQSIADQKDNK